MLEEQIIELNQKIAEQEQIIKASKERKQSSKRNRQKSGGKLSPLKNQKQQLEGDRYSSAKKSFNYKSVDRSFNQDNS